MSSVLVVTPLVVASWPLMSAAITAAIGTMGFAAVQHDGSASREIAGAKTTAEIELEESEILAGTGAIGGEMVVERDGIRAVFSRDARGRPQALHRRERTLQGRAEADRRVARGPRDAAVRLPPRSSAELKDRQMTILEERVGEDQAIHIRVRNG